jgi:hypothetical protein
MIKTGDIIENPINQKKEPMTISNFPVPTAWVAIVTGVSAILAVIFLALMAAVNPSFGMLNDVFNAIVGILYAEHHDWSPLISQIALALALLGAIFTIVGSVLIIYGFTDFVLAGWYSGVGYGLIGLWLVAFCYSMLRGGALPHNLVIFGLVVGAFMAVGLIGIPGIFAGIDSMESMPWYLYLAFFGYLGTYILYPIWAIGLGRNLILK